MRARRDFRDDPNWPPHAPQSTDVSLIDPNDPKLPAVIRALHAEHIICEDDDFLAWFNVAGFYDMRLESFAVGITNPPPALTAMKCQKVIDGLWFYEEVEYRTRPNNALQPTATVPPVSTNK
jgi:hypothetical protein